MADIVAQKEKKQKEKKLPLAEYKDKKKEAQKLSRLYSYSEKKQSKIQDCSVTLWRETFEHIQTKDLKEKFSSNNCHLRFCPVCSWKKASKTAGIAYTNLSLISDSNFLFLTLTVKNCEIVDLKDTLKHMSESFHRLKQVSIWKNTVKGYIRSIECTVADDGKMHPHFHIILDVNSSYLKHKKSYITQSKFTDLWRDALKIDYQPIVHITQIKSKTEFDNPLVGAVCETIKYTLKSSDLLKMTPITFSILDLSMRGVKTLNCGGSLLHCLKPSENHKLSDEEWILLSRELFRWHNGDYVLSPKKF